MTENPLSVTHLGKQARNILAGADTAAIFGITSRGIFLRIDPRGVIFLSYESSRGPITLNLDQFIPAHITLHRTQTVTIRDGEILFPASKLSIRMTNAANWYAAPNPIAPLSAFERNQRITATAREVIRQKANAGMAPILADLLDIGPSKDPNLIRTTNGYHFPQLGEIVNHSDVNIIISNLSKFLGLGFGLTPSGDDLLIGFLLACNRYQDVLAPSFNLPQFNETIVQLAYRKTNLISANLIECASQGQADERLISALDGMLAGTLDPVSCANLFLGWGHSSGCDALAGMALAAYQRPKTHDFN